MPVVVKIVNHGRVRYRVIVPPIGGQPRRVRLFKSREDAIAFASTIGSRRDQSIVAFLRIPQLERGRILECLRRVGGVQALEQAAEDWLKAQAPLSKSIQEAADEFLKAKKTKGKSWQYLENLQIALGWLIEKHGERSVNGLTHLDLEAWLSGHEWAPETQTTYLRRLDTFWRWAIARGYGTGNPTVTVERPTKSAASIRILKPAECQRLLAACQVWDPGLLPYFAVCMFAGLRPDEAKQITKESFHDGWIEVKAAHSKTRRRRLVEIHPTLQAWLDLGGEIGWTNWRKRFRAVRAAAVVGLDGPHLPIQWAPDSMRHSFASYSYPLKGAQWTSNECGHSERTLFARYRELVSRADAEKFWQILPTVTKPQKGEI